MTSALLTLTLSPPIQLRLYTAILV